MAPWLTAELPGKSSRRYWQPACRLPTPRISPELPGRRLRRRTRRVYRHQLHQRTGRVASFRAGHPDEHSIERCGGGRVAGAGELFRMDSWARRVLPADRGQYLRDRCRHRRRGSLQCGLCSGGKLCIRRIRNGDGNSYRNGSVDRLDCASHAGWPGSAQHPDGRKGFEQWQLSRGARCVYRCDLHQRSRRNPAFGSRLADRYSGK